jgi:pimeloyl-ACP methyl ester carboxylesterase
MGALILLHGYMGSRRDFTRVEPALSSLADTFSYDHRGHGEARNKAAHGPLDLDVLTADLAHFLEEKRISRAHLLGHSMGGMIALRFALAHPSRVESLILAGTTAHAARMGPVPVPTLKSRFLGPLRTALGRDLAARMGRAIYSEETTRVLFTEIVRAGHRQIHPRAIALLHPAIESLSSLTGRLKEITAPSTVIWGAKDDGFAETSRELAQLIPNARGVSLPHSSHYLLFEQPAAFVDAVREHFRSLPQK